MAKVVNFGPDNFTLKIGGKEIVPVGDVEFSVGSSLKGEFEVGEMKAVEGHPGHVSIELKPKREHINVEINIDDIKIEEPVTFIEDLKKL